MSRDVSQLEEVSKLFTEDVLKSIIIKAKNSNSTNVEVTSWDFGSANKKGDSYLSTVNKVTLEGKIDGEPVQVKIVVKALPNNLGRRITFRSCDFFKNEIAFYTEVVPKFQEFLESKGKSSLLSVPKYLAHCLDGDNDFLVLEDAGVAGFQPLMRQDCLDVDQISFILQSLAKFHAISFAYKDQRQDFYTISKSIFETYFRKDLWNWYGKFHTRLVDIVKDALAKEYPGSEAEKRFNSHKPGYFYMKSAELCNLTKEKSSVINHGDCWIPNFLICDNTILILDFQLTRRTSPILDVAFLIFTCTDKALRDQHFDKVLQVYYDQLSCTITELGSDPKKVYPKELYMKEVKEKFIHGVSFAMEAVPFSMLDEEDTFDLDIIDENKPCNIADVWTLSPFKKKEDRIRLANLIIEATERGFI